MKIKRLAPLDNVGFNMTPMIDVVFQLIVFLMLAVDFTNLDLEFVRPALSTQAREDFPPPPDRLTVNIVHRLPDGVTDCPQYRYEKDKLVHPCQIDAHWKIIVRGQDMNDAELLRTLKIEADLDREPVTEKNLHPASNRYLIIRPDASAPAYMIGKVLEACGNKAVKIWRTEIGARNPGATD
ncbi:MAG: biopolymer transporter ExbD [Planctomycetes bacterium]|nr:biopolymer transporter ExbD [Planctomycetota bacterium]